MLIRLCDKVISGLSREPKALAHTLLGRGLLSQEKVEEIVQIPATDTESARKIYNVVLGCVQYFPHRYTDFISVLEEKSLLYCDLLTDLKDTYHELGKYLGCRLYTTYHSDPLFQICLLEINRLACFRKLLPLHR